MPFTKTGKYYKIVNGKRQYNKRYDKEIYVSASGRKVGATYKNAQRTYKNTERRIQKQGKEYIPSFGRTALSGLGSAGGGALGGWIGGPGGALIGGQIGGALGNGLSSVLGLGDYQIKENVFMSGRLPTMMNMPSGGGTVIRFQEYLSDIYTTADVGNPASFNLQSYLINAANPDTFPYLSQIASNYEQYAFEGIMFQFRSTSADALNSTNTALGSVMLATQYDVSDTVFASKSEMLNYEFSNSIKPSDSCLHMVECAPNQNVLSDLYTLRSATLANTDPRMFHLGRFTVATVGFQAANVNIGELHVTYQVRLLKPKLYASLGNLSDFAILTGTYTNAVPFTTMVSSSISNFVVTSASGTITLPASAIIKTYRIEVFWSGTTAVVTNYPVLTVANGTLASYGETPAEASTANKMSAYFAITTLGNSKTVSFSYDGSGALPTSAQVCVVRIMQVPQNLIS